MEHIVQFGINIDDHAIIEAVKEKAEKEIVKTLTNQVGCQIFERNPWSNSYDQYRISDFSKRLLMDFFEEHKTEIINAAAVHLADKLARSKAGKAILGGIK